MAASNFKPEVRFLLVERKVFRLPCAVPGADERPQDVCDLDALPGSLTVSRSSGDLLKLEDAVRYPGAWRKAILITVSGLAVMLGFAFALRNVGASVLIGMLCWLVGTVLVIDRDSRLMDAATRIFHDHPEYTAQQAANAARRELGVHEVRYP